MDCLAPVKLKSGLIVPCGKCPCCLSAHRAEVSIRLQIHSKFYNGSPLMIGLSYDNKHLLYGNNSTLYRPHVSAFLKAYKRKYRLRSDVFTYFGCGEYGSELRTHRPHFHLVFFGDIALEQLFWQDSRKAEERLESCWPHGRAWCGIALTSGIHYICKYYLKDGLDLCEDQLPFSIYSKNLGAAWFKSEECFKIRQQLRNFVIWKNEIYAGCPPFDQHDRGSLLAAKEYFDGFIPKFTTVLDSGKVVKLPRYFRRKLIGTYEVWKDSPFWLPNYIDALLRSEKFYSDNKNRLDAAIAANQIQAELHADKINKHLLINKYNKDASLRYCGRKKA